jgi:hypothetical protein
MAKGYKARGGGSNPLNFKVVGGTSEPANPKENTIWINTDENITDWAFSADESFLKKLGLTVRVSHAENGSSTDVTIIDNSNGAVIATKTITGTQYYSVFTNQVVSFTTASGKSGQLTCSVRQTTTPFFTGDVVVGGVTIGTVGLGTAGNSSFAWDGEQFLVNSADNNVEGLVWIKTAQASSASFNALKKSNLQVYPSAVTQYVNGAWAEKTAKAYQGGKWVGFDLYLYNLDAFGKVWRTGGYRISNESGAKAAALTLTNGSGGVLQIRQGTAAACGVAHYPDQVDLTNYSTLTFEGVISSNSASLAGLGIWSSFGNTYIYEGRVATIYASVNGKATLDISALKGNHYIGFWIHNNTNYINVNSIKLS